MPGELLGPETTVDEQKDITKEKLHSSKFSFLPSLEPCPTLLSHIYCPFLMVLITVQILKAKAFFVNCDYEKPTSCKQESLGFILGSSTLFKVVLRQQCEIEIQASFQNSLLLVFFFLQQAIFQRQIAPTSQTSVLLSLNPLMKSLSAQSMPVFSQAMVLFHSLVLDDRNSSGGTLSC